MPRGVVHQHDRDGTRRDVAADFVDVSLHGAGIDVGLHQGCSRVARGTDGAEHIGALITLIGGLTGACAAFGPLADAAVLLADSHLVLEPDFDSHLRRNIRQRLF